jgi:hypothetical protein
MLARETCEMSGKGATGEMGKKVLSSELEADEKNGTVRGPKFEVFGTSNIESRLSRKSRASRATTVNRKTEVDSWETAVNPKEYKRRVCCGN